MNRNFPRRLTKPKTELIQSFVDANLCTHEEAAIAFDRGDEETIDRWRTQLAEENKERTLNQAVTDDRGQTDRPPA